jgi:hypothetical protein
MKTLFTITIRDDKGQMHNVNVVADTDEIAKAFARKKFSLPADAKIYTVHTLAEDVEVA